MGSIKEQWGCMIGAHAHNTRAQHTHPIARPCLSLSFRCFRFSWFFSLCPPTAHHTQRPREPNGVNKRAMGLYDRCAHAQHTRPAHPPNRTPMFVFVFSLFSF